MSKSEIELIKEDIREIRKDVKDLLKFKWQIFGGVGALSFVVATIISIVGALK